MVVSIRTDQIHIMIQLIIKTKMLNNKAILITGGAGYLGRRFIETVLRDYPGVKKIVVYSRDNQKHEELRQLYPRKQFPQLRFFIGDVRDYDRLVQACEDIDVLIHAASLDSLTATEYNPEECIKTNIIGSNNVVKAAIKNCIANIVALSSEKACSPVSLYGASQLVAEKLFVAANNMRGNKDVRFCVVRFGSVIGSRHFDATEMVRKKKLGGRYLYVPDKNMTGFMITVNQVIECVLFAIGHQLGGEIFIPKSTSYKIVDLANAVAPEMVIQETELSVGEKIHQTLISATESVNAIEDDSNYVIIPAITFTGSRSKEDYLAHYNANSISAGFRYTSSNEKLCESVDNIKRKIKQFLK